ncbi:hypothetical protein QFC20_003712 [Naganishia adeliensis]|uniref:Uncharacterized protein n=1 Tax=Naganishia adeliensis TaxID=92952 RepID=A0ACC2W816_9TREE|nr:hypothetical protein QFC20_003712 [Naganishia adeliensis]
MSTPKDLDIRARKRGFKSDDDYQFCRLNEEIRLNLASMETGRRLRKTDEQWKQGFRKADGLLQSQYNSLKEREGRNKDKPPDEDLAKPDGEHADEQLSYKPIDQSSVTSYDESDEPPKREKRCSD